LNPVERAYASTPTANANLPADEVDPQVVWPEHRVVPRRFALLQGRGWKALRLSSDALALILGNVAALLGASAANIDIQNAWVIWLQPGAVLILLASWGMYRDRIQVKALENLGQMTAAASLAAISLIAADALIDPQAGAAPLIARAWVFGLAYLVGTRLLLGWTHRAARANRLIAKPTLILGSGQIGARVEGRLRSQPHLGLQPVGYLDSDPPSAEMVPERVAPVLGPPTDIREIARRTGAQHVVLAFTSARDHTLLPFIRECEGLRLELSLVPRLFDSVNVHLAMDHLGGLPLLGLHTIDPKGWQFGIKHALDRTFASLLLLLLSPLMLVIAAAVKLSSPGPVLFSQRRIGRDGRDFQILKFRSMTLEPAGQTSDLVLLPNDTAPGGVEGTDRRTAVGSFLRNASLDELPQLLNVVRGEMSLVGPRPERPQYVELFGQRVNRYDDRHRVKSGVTGWAQVNGLRGRTSLADRVEWDNYYVQNWSLGLDIKILLMTAWVLGRRDE